VSIPRPTSLRSRLFAGITLTVAVSVAVTVVIGAVLTRRSLETDALRSLERQVELLAAQRAATPSSGGDELGEFLATEQVRLAVLTSEQAELLLPADGAEAIRRQGRATGGVTIRGESFLYAARLQAGDAFVLLRSAHSQEADWDPFLVSLAIAGLVGAALAAGIALLLARAVARPLSRVVGASLKLAAGEDTAPLPVEGPSETAALASAFNHLSSELQRAQDAERSFLLSVSHELKTPLTVIRGHAEALADGIVGGDRAASVIERESLRLERLIGDLLDLARLRRRSFSVATGEVDLAAIALEAVARHERMAVEYGVALATESRETASARGDAGRILQAVSNLVENAVRCAPRGGSVRVTAMPGRLDVTDDGPGLAAADLERAFERFYLYERYGADRPVGTGLGLAIVQELVHAMGGNVAVASGLGRGTTFSITLPT
jgi:two-component system sensor histidine kinase BaeS